MTINHGILAVDAGGTRTRGRLYDSAGHVLAFSEAGPGNIAESMSQAVGNILSVVQDLQRQVNLIDGINLPLGIGVAGLEVPEARSEFKQRLQGYGSPLLVQSDAHTACLGAHQGEDGIIAIIGTGSIFWRIHGEQVARLSGFGYPLDDRYAGCGMGLKVLQKTLDYLDCGQQAGAMTAAVAAEFANDPYRLAAFAVNASKAEIASFAPWVFRYPEDAVAWGLIDTGVSYLLSKINYLRQDAPDLPVALCGGMAEAYQQYLAAKISGLSAPKGDALDGALMMMRLHQSGSMDAQQIYGV